MPSSSFLKIALELVNTTKSNTPTIMPRTERSKITLKEKLVEALFKSMVMEILQV